MSEQSEQPPPRLEWECTLDMWTLWNQDEPCHPQMLAFVCREGDGWLAAMYNSRAPEKPPVLDRWLSLELAKCSIENIWERKLGGVRDERQ